MRFGRLTINLSKPAAPQTETEVGTGRPLNLYALMDGDVIDTSKVKIRDFVNMRKNDGCAMALYNLITMPITALNWDIEPHPDDKDGVQAEFVEKVLRTPPHMGGMSTPMSLVIADMLRAVLEGYRLYEKVWTISDDGKFVYKKIATRDNQTITIMSDDKGGFNGAKQLALFNTTLDTVRIEREKCFLFTYRKEIDPLLGESAFVAAYQHYDEKRKLYYLGRLAAQALSIPPKVAKAGDKATQAQMDAVSEALNALVGVNSATVLPQGFDMAQFNAGNGKFDIMGLINHHNTAMAMSVLAHFMMLGNATDGGSWALSRDQSDLFIMSEKSLAKTIEEHITSYLLPDLLIYNFETPLFPTFKFNEMTDSTIGMLKDAFEKIVDKLPEGIPDYLIEGIVDKLGDQLNIDKPDGEKGNARTIAEKATAAAAGNANNAPVNNSDRRHSHFLADNRWARALTPAEQKVNFAGLQNKYNSLESDFATSVKPVWDDITDRTIAAVKKLLDAKDYKGINDLEIAKADAYKKTIIQNMMEAYNYSKTGAADELGKKSPSTPQQSRDLINQYAQSYVDKQYSDLTFNIRAMINDAIKTNQLSSTDLAVADVLSSVRTLFGGYFDKNVAPGVSVAVSTAVNTGRGDVFNAYHSQIAKFMYSAILDRRVCAICQDLDGTIVSAEQYYSSDNKWHCPIHFLCRCLWIAIMKDELDQPPITGFPTKPGGVTEPPLASQPFKFDPEAPAQTPAKQPFKNFEDKNLETIAQEDIAGRPNAEINTQIEKLLKSTDPAALRDAIRLSLQLPKDDAGAMLGAITLPDGTSVGNHFYTVKFDPALGKIVRVLKDPAVDPLKMTAEEIAALVGIPIEQ